MSHYTDGLMEDSGVNTLALIVLLFSQLIVATQYVAHKDDQLEVYLNMIAANLDEKTEIVEHIRKKPEGTYIDIGTGGDGIAAIIKKIDTTAKTVLIAGDINPSILENIPRRHPEIIKCLVAASTKSTGTKLFLQQLDATYLGHFDNESVSGINASALVHEIVSYAGGKEGVRKFIAEACRVLARDGVLVYRDPEAVYNRNEVVTANLLALPLKYFANIFLTRFLDKTFSKTPGKIEMYGNAKIFFEIFRKDEDKATLLDYESYKRVPTNEIDFQKPYKVVLSRGLCQELERHYLMFLHEYASLLFVKGAYDIERNAYKILFRATRAQKEFLNYCKKLEIPTINGEIAVDAYQALQVYQMGIPKHLGTGLIINKPSEECCRKIEALCRNYGFDFEKFSLRRPDALIIDYKVLALLWQEFKELFTTLNTCTLDEESRSFLDWLQREGEEVYYYASPDEFIAFVGHASRREKDGEKYLLAPLGASYNKSVIRHGYSSFLAESLIVTNEAGSSLTHEDRKRVIHFAKMPLEDAVRNYEEIIHLDPEHNAALIAFVALLKKEK
jgi:SAM-dependent methyltransferase